MSLNKKSVDDINVKGKRVLVRCDFNVPLKNGEITDETRIVAALPTIQKLINDGGKVILCSHLGKVKNGPNEGESLAPVAKRLSEKLGKEVVFVSDYNVTGEAATKAVEAMKEGDVVLLQNTRFRGEESTCFRSRRDKVHQRKGRFQRCRLPDGERDCIPWQCS